MGYPVIAANPSKPSVLVRAVNPCARYLVVVRVKLHRSFAGMAGT